MERRVIEMTIDETIALVKIERECIIRADVCDRKCEKCDLVQDSGKLIDMYEQLVELLEELKSYREIGTVEECRNSVLNISKAYNKAIDDFVNVCEKQFTTMYGQRYVDMRDILNIAEQLKRGAENEQSI